MDKLHQVALLSIGRAVGFGGLAIATVMVGLSFDPVLAFRTGGILLLLLLAILLLKAQRAPSANFRRTEAWLLLDRGDRPDDSVAGSAMPAALKNAYLLFARWTAAIAAAVWAAAVLSALFGVGANAQI